ERLDQLSAMPAMHVGAADLSAVRTFLDGYCLGLQDSGIAPSPLAGWRHWVEGTYRISHPAWSWVDILIHELGSEQTALRELPSLYRAFREHVAQTGVEALRSWAAQRIAEAHHGAEQYAPSPRPPSKDLGGAGS